MDTQEEKQNQLAARKRTLLASQNVLSKEIDEVIKILDPIGLTDEYKDDFPFKVRQPVMSEPSGKEVA